MHLLLRCTTSHVARCIEVVMEAAFRVPFRSAPRVERNGTAVGSRPGNVSAR
jgi:hypothetical protein